MSNFFYPKTGEVVFSFVQRQKLLWPKGAVAFRLFSWVLTFAKTKTWSKAQSNRSKITNELQPMRLQSFYECDTCYHMEEIKKKATGEARVSELV